MKKLSTLLTLLVCFILFSTSAWSATWIVDNAGGGDFTTIQAAVNAASGNDIIYVNGSGTNYTENVNIPGGKNQLSIIGVNDGSGLPVLDGSGVTNPKVAFRVSSDNVTIRNMVIQNYNYGGATNVDFGSAQRGVGIESLIASSGHNFSDNTITNCNWGIYVREGNSISVKNNTINNTVATSHGSGYPNTGGTGIAFVSAGVSLDENEIQNNSVSTSAFYGVFFGRRLDGGTPVNGDNVIISNNTISNAGIGNNGFAIYLNNIKPDDALRIEDNTLNNNNAGLRLAQNTTANTDINVFNNEFNNTVSSIEVQTAALFSGGTLYDIMFNNGNIFDEGTPASTPGAVAALDVLDTEVVSNGTNRFIRNRFANAIVDGEGYLSAAAASTNVKVYAMAGFYPSEVALVSSNPANGQNMLITGEVDGSGNNLAKAQGNAIGSTIFTINPLSNLTVTFENIDVELNLNVTQYGIYTGSSNTTVNLCNFTTANVISATGIAAIATGTATSNFSFDQNTVNGFFATGLIIDQNNVTISCNDFNFLTTTNVIIDVTDWNADVANITGGEIINNTFTSVFGSTATNIRVIYPTVGSGGLDIGTNGNGNFFMNGDFAIDLTLMANGQVTIGYNNFQEADYTDWIDNSAAFDVNAGWNYWEILGINPNAEISAMITGAGAANVFFLPIYSSGVDTDLAGCGFQADLTSIWTPVYTAVNVGDPLTDPDALFFWTIEDALADPNTGIGSPGLLDRYAVYMYNNGTFSENNPLSLDYPMWIGGAPAQVSNGNTAPDATFWTVTAQNNAAPLFEVTVTGTLADPITFDSFTLVPSSSGASTANNAILVDAVGAMSYLTITNSIFDVAHANQSNAIFVDNTNTVSIDNFFIYNNTFMKNDAGYALRVETPITSTDVQFLNNNILWNIAGVTPGFSIYFEDGVDGLTVLGNNFEAGILLESVLNDIDNVEIGSTGTHLLGFLQGNTFFNPNVSGLDYGIFIESPIGGGDVAATDFRIVQNSFQDITEAIYFDVEPTEITLANIFINENDFENIGASSIVLDGIPPYAGQIDARFNFWGTDDGPIALMTAPTWHDNSVPPIQIIANSYNYDVNNAASPSGVLYEADYINFVYWWQNFNANMGPGSHTGDQFAPFVNSNGDVFASLIVALDNTTTGNDIFITPGEFVESNTIQQPSNPYTVSIYGDVNGGTYFRPDGLNANGTYNDEYMFYFSGDVTISLYHLHLEDYRPSPTNQDEDVFAGVFVDGDDLVNPSIVRFYNGSISGINFLTNGVGFFAEGNANVRVENSDLTENEFAGIWIEEDALNGPPTGSFINNMIDGGGISNYGIGSAGETYVTIQYNTIFDNTGASAGIFSSGIGAGSLTIEYNQIFDNTYGIELGVTGAGDNYSAAIIRNNAIYDNVTAGLIYFPDVSSVVTAENNFWGNDAGPASLGDLGLGDSQRNGFFDLGITQGNAVVDGNLDSEIDYLPYRLTSGFTPNISMIAGARFAPIVRTNSANIPLGFYANIMSADADVTSGSDEGIYVYGGNYADLFYASKDEVRFIGKNRMAPYAASWLINPQGSATNAWGSAKGADVNGPLFITHNVPGSPYNAEIDALTEISIQGFTFDATDKTATVDGPYTGNYNDGMYLSGAADEVTVNQNTFLADDDDNSINFVVGTATNWTITNNLFDASASTPANDPIAVNVTNGLFGGAHSDILIDNNDIIEGAVNIYAGNNDVSGIMVSFNEFTDSKAGVIASAVGGFGSQLSNIYISNNVFYDYPTIDQFAFGILAGTPDNAVATDWTTDIMFTENFVGVDPLDVANTMPAVGFQNATPLLTYTSAITATCNWWGSVNGPTFALNPGGDGATVSERAYMAPWLSGSANNATFGFDPMDACDAGIRVWVNNTGDPLDQFIIFPGLQMAVDDPNVVNQTYEFIFVHDDYTTGGTPGFLNESTTIANWNINATWFLSAETAANEIGLAGNLEFAGTGFAYNLFMLSPMRVQGDLILDNIGCQGWLQLLNSDFTVEGHITEGYFLTVAVSCQVFTGGTGYLVKENVVTGGINNFPILGQGATTGTPAEFVVNSGGFTLAQNNILKVRANAIDPVTAKGMGQNGFDINNLWSVDFTNNAAMNPNFAMQLRNYDNSMYDVNFDNVTSYGAFWDMNPVATQWATKKSNSSWNGSDGIQVTNLNLESGPTDWAIFSGQTSFALSNEPNQARNIMWYSTTDKKIDFKWTRNDANAQYYAILAREGSMIAAPSTFTPTPISVYVPYTCPVLPNGPWTCSPGHLNFADGNVNSVDPNFNWANSLFHGDQAPTDVRVVKIGKYGPGAIFDASVNNLAQGTFYEFFVANFNYGDGSTAVADMESGADGMANYNLNPNTLNPRTRKTMPAVYMTIDFNGGFATNVANQPNRVWAYSVVGSYNPMDIYNNIVKNNGVLGSYVVENQHNGDDLLGGHVAEVCNDGSMSWTANNIRLHFKNYGRYNGSGWIIKYSENNDTKTFTTPSIAAFTDRTRTANTDYYLVSAYDGDGKVAYKYDNMQKIRFQVDEPTDVTLTETPVVMPTCEGNNVTLVSAPNSYPNATFDRWEFDNGGGWTTFTTSLPGGSTVTGGSTITITLDYGDNGTDIRAVYISNSICDLGLEFNSNAIELEIYDATLTGLQPYTTAPAVVDNEAPGVCEGANVTFQADAGGPFTSPNSLTFIGWEYFDGVWNPLADGALVGATISGSATQTMTITGATLAMNGYDFRAVWQNGDCNVLETIETNLEVIEQPVISQQPVVTPVTVCAGTPIDVDAIATPFTSVQWQISNDNSTWVDLVDGLAFAYLGGNAVIAGATTQNLTITPADNTWDAFYVQVVYTNEGAEGDECITTSSSVQLDILLAPIVTPFTSPVTVCEGSNNSYTAVVTNPYNTPVTWEYFDGTWNSLGAGVVDGTTVSFTGAGNETLNLNNIDLMWDGYQVRVTATNGTCSDTEGFTINVDELPVVVTNPIDDDVCQFGDLQYVVDFTPVATTVTWQFWNGVVWANVVSGTSLTANTFNVPTITTIGGTTTLDLTNVSIAINGWDVRVALDNGVCGTVNSTSANMGIFTVPSVPNPIGAQNILSHKFDVTYPADPNALTWDIQVADDAGFSNIVFSTTGAGASPFTGMTDCILDPASTYYFRVRAVNACGSSAWSTPSNIVTLDPTVTNMAWLGGFDGDFGTGDLGTPTASQTLRITYYQLDADIAMTIPADFEAFIGGNWVNGVQNLGLTLYLGTSGTPLTRDILVRFNATVCGVIDEDITIASNELCVGNTGITVPSIAVEGFGKVPQPTVQASAVYFTANDDTEFDFTWTNGNGNGRLVTIVEDGATPWSPIDFTDYSSIASTTLSGSNEITTGNWIVAAGSGSGPLTVDGLTAGVVYYAYVFEFNECASGTEDYLLPGAVGQVYQLSFLTNEPSTPMNGIPNQTSGVAFKQSDNTTGLAIEVLLLDRAGDPIANPFAGFSVSIAGDPALGTVTVNSGSTTMANGAASTAGTPMTITWTYASGILNANLEASTAQLGVLPGVSNDFVLNVAPPTTQAKIILWVGVPCINNTEFKWTNGDGASRLVVGRDGSLPELPTDLTDYSALANTNFSLAGTLGTSTKVLAVINGSGNSITVTGLTLNQTYYFRVYEFNGTGGLERYLTDNASFNPRSRKITCSDGNNLFDLIVENFNVVSGKGKGIVSWNTEYEQNISGFEVSRIDLTEGSSMNPMLVGTYMNAQELVAAGNTTTGQTYKYTDNTVTLEVGRTYLYQLTAVAYDGTRIDVAESEITITDDIIAGPAEFSVTPVQVINNEATFKVITNTTQDATIELYDVIGNRVAVIANGIMLGVGSNEFSCPVDKLVNGTYIISVNGKDVSAIQKFQIAR
ncbi:MAG: right-handed parallel beta-helix repeat-containing protein [Candidatus Kapabacteria bacterium]|nr:right-handed parallel beta-helix repeat-containing protein [Candidatus Kapabacteria bacterium]